MIVNFLRQSQTYNVEQKRSKKGGIGSRVASYDNSFYTNLDVSMPFPVAELLICKFIEDILLGDSLKTLDDGWQYCNLQICEDEITGKLSFSVRLVIPTTQSAYAADYVYINPAYGSEEYAEDWREFIGFDADSEYVHAISVNVK